MSLCLTYSAIKNWINATFSNDSNISGPMSVIFALKNSHSIFTELHLHFTKCDKNRELVMV